ncbi:hypothetical protein CSB37_03545 [bacterium DOLZORAL124_38_8]|nr:MAG: hypothetical protein CSB37_03545 [bacterium DOLZORAL124_38_8]
MFLVYVFFYKNHLKKTTLQTTQEPYNEFDMKKSLNFHFRFDARNLVSKRFSEKKIQKEIAKKFSKTSLDSSFKFLESTILS